MKRSDVGRDDPGLRITPRHVGQSLLLQLEGRLTAATVALFRAAFASALHAPTPTLLLDLRDLTDIDARGVGELVAAHAMARHQKRSIRFLIRNGRVAHLLRLAHLDRALPILEEAQIPRDALAERTETAPESP